MDCLNMKVIFEIIAAVGSLATFGAFIMLLLKDKNKQKQLDKLTGVISSLTAQSDLMKQHNDLVSEQVVILRNTELLKKQDGDSTKRIIEIEEEKFKLSVKPYLWINGVSFNGTSNEMKVDINNKGETANLIDFRVVKSNITLHSLSLPYELEKGSNRYIFGKYRDVGRFEKCEYEIDVIFEDKIGTKYYSKIKGKGTNAKIIETNEISKKINSQ
jgi:hypothetical protein